MSTKSTAELQELISMLRAHGVTEFEQEGLKLRLTVAPSQPDRKISREEAVAELPDNFKSALDRLPPVYRQQFKP